MRDAPTLVYRGTDLAVTNALDDAWRLASCLSALEQPYLAQASLLQAMIETVALWAGFAGDAAGEKLVEALAGGDSMSRGGETLDELLSVSARAVRSCFDELLELMRECARRSAAETLAARAATDDVARRCLGVDRETLMAALGFPEEAMPADISPDPEEVVAVASTLREYIAPGSGP